MAIGNILLVDDDPVAIGFMERVLHDLSDLRFATNGVDALKLAREMRPSLMLLDAEMPGMSGFEVLESFRADEELAAVPVIFVTSHSEPEFELTSFGQGALDFITKPVSAELARARISAHLLSKTKSEELLRLVRIDPQTGLMNRVGFGESMKREWGRVKRTGNSISLLRVDIDHFDAYARQRSAASTAECLRRIAQCLCGVARRPEDQLARFHASGFALLLPSTERDGAQHVAHRVLDAIESMQIAHVDSPTARHITVSVGLGVYDAQSPCSVTTPEMPQDANINLVRRRTDDLLKAAESALALARSAGRAQGWLMDIAHIDAPRLSSAVSPEMRAAWRQRGASQLTRP